VLGVSASGRDAGCGGEDWEVVVLSDSERESNTSNPNMNTDSIAKRQFEKSFNVG
jgi:hypothetical protein